MIRSFSSKTAQDVYDGTNSKAARRLPVMLHGKAQRLLDLLNAAPKLQVLKTPPGNRLEKLSGDLKDYWSLRINNQWRIIFRWVDSDAFDVDVIDYH